MDIFKNYSFSYFLACKLVGMTCIARTEELQRIKGEKMTQKGPRALKRVKMDMYFSLKSNCEIGCDKRCVMLENK